jgi:hypothetical protein
MRVDIREPDQRGRTYHVFLNGEDVTDKCYLADTAKLYVECYVLKDGKPFLNSAKTELVTERLYGDVMIYEDISMKEIKQQNACKEMEWYE